MITKRVVTLILILAGFLVAACSSPNLATRIDRGMQEFDSWPEDVQETVRSGQIEIGFTPAQVRMAWGEPTRVSRDRINGEAAERWEWGKKVPQVGIGIGIGKSGSRSGVRGSVGTTVGGRERVTRTVWIQNGVVNSYAD